MTAATYTDVLDLAAGALVLTAVLIVWRRGLRSMVRLLTCQGIALAALPITIGIHDERPRVDRCRHRRPHAACHRLADAAGPCRGRRGCATSARARRC